MRFRRFHQSRCLPNLGRITLRVYPHADPESLMAFCPDCGWGLEIGESDVPPEERKGEVVSYRCRNSRCGLEVEGAIVLRG